MRGLPYSDGLASDDIIDLEKANIDKTYTGWYETGLTVDNNRRMWYFFKQGTGEFTFDHILGNTLQYNKDWRYKRIQDASFMTSFKSDVGRHRDKVLLGDLLVK